MWIEIIPCTAVIVLFVVIIMDEMCAASEPEHVRLHTGGNESSATYIIIIIITVLLLCIHIIGNDVNKSKFYSERN